MNKKGIFFTLLALFIITILYMIYNLNIPTVIPNRSDVVGKSSIMERIILADDFFRSVKESYLVRSLKVSSFNALKSLLAYEKNESKFITNIITNFSEVLLNGTLDGKSLTNSGIDFMLNNTMRDRVRDIEIVSKDYLKIQSNITIFNISIYQSNITGPFNVLVEMSLNIFLDNGVAKWNSTENIAVIVDITELYDPLYAINTQNNYLNLIKKSNITIWNNNTLLKFIYEKGYKHEEKAPSFLYKLINSSNASSCCGLESIIYYETNINSSFIDYCVWYNKCSGSDPKGNFSLYYINGISNSTYQFKLEPYHISESKLNVINYTVPI